MKKLVLLAAVAFSMSFVACGSGDANAANDSVDSAANDSTPAQVENNAAPQDSAANDSANVQA